MEKRERFKKVAVSRTNKILKDIRLLSNCSNKNNYSYNENDAKKIFVAIDGEIKKAKAKFFGITKDDKFSL